MTSWISCRASRSSRHRRCSVVTSAATPDARRGAVPSVPLLISQAFNGLALGMLLALVSSGLTIILGTLGVLNFTHGALFMVGAYSIFVVAGATGSFVLGLFIGVVIMLVI